MNKITGLFKRLKKLSLASICLIFMAITIPLVEYDIDRLQSEKDQLIVNTIRLEINRNYSEIFLLLPSVPNDIIKLHKNELKMVNPAIIQFSEAINEIDSLIGKLKLVQLALLVGPVIIFTLAEIYRSEKEPKIAKYLVLAGITTVIILLGIRKYVWSSLNLPNI